MSVLQRFVCGLLGLLFLGACGEGFKIGLVTDTGSVDDKGFNSAAWKGVQTTGKSFNLQEGSGFRYIESDGGDKYVGNIEKLITEGHTVIVTVGFLMTEATVEMAKKYPKVKFIGVDQFRALAKDAVDPTPNYIGLVFREEQAGYLSGILAGSLSKTKKLGGVYGPNVVPPVVGFKKGFELGAKAVEAAIEVKSEYHPPGDNAFVNPTWGAKTAKGFIDAGADVIFAAGGKTGNGALETTATERDGGKELWCIGVDVDQWETVKAARSCLVSSAVKLIDLGVSDLLKLTKDGKFPTGGNYYGKVGLADFHDFTSKLPEELKKKLTDTKDKLEKGEIKLEVDTSTP